MNSKLKIYFFSGTGNAKNVAHWIAEKGKEKNYQVEIKDLSKIDRKNPDKPESNSLIGFISPTHGFNLPPVMMYFIFRFPGAAGNNKVFIINTRAGVKVGKLFLPGLSGLALWLSAIVLFVKGYKIVGLRPIDLPSNWISVHPALKEKNIVSIYDRCKKITYNFAEDILNNKKNFRATYDLIQDILIAPISILYFLVGRFIFAKSFYSNSRCTNCGLCVDNCPVKAIKTINNQPFWTYNCESCMKCMNECSNRAIETGHGYIIGILFLVNSWFLVMMWGIIYEQINFDDSTLIFKVIEFIIDNGSVLILLILSYRLIHLVKRINIFKQLIEYTSLTRYKFWGRYNTKKLIQVKETINFNQHKM